MAIESRLLDLTVSSEGVRAGVAQAQSLLASLTSDLGKAQVAAAETNIKVRDAGVGIGRAFASVTKDLLPAADGLTKIARQIDAVGQAQTRGAASHKQAADMINRLTGSLSEAEREVVGLIQASGQTERALESSFKKGTLSAADYKAKVLEAREATYQQVAALQDVIDAQERSAKAAAGLDALRRQYDATYAEIRRYGEAMTSAKAVLDAVNASENERARILKSVSDAYDPAIKASNARAAALQKEQEAQAALMASYREQAALARSQTEGQAMWNTYAGVQAAPTGSAAVSAAVFQEAAAAEKAAIARSLRRDAIDAETRAMEQQAKVDAAAALREEAQALDALKARVDPAAAALRRLDEDKAKLDAAFAAGKLTGGKAEYDDLTAAISRNRAMIEASTVSQKGMTNALGLTRAQMAALSPQINDIVSGLIMGQPPMMIFAQQSGQVVQALQAGGAEMPAFAAGTLAIAAGFAALAAGYAGVIYAVHSYRSEVKEVERVNALVGQSVGMTTSGLLKQAEGIGNAAGISTASARAIQNAYLGTGKIGGTVLTELAATTRGWALATGQDLDAARDDLARLFADPTRAVDELTAKYGAFDDAQRQLIKNYQAQGNLERAQALLLQGIEDRAKGAAERMSALGKAWEWIKKQANDGVEWVGENAGEPSRQKRIEMLQLRQTNGIYLTSGLRQDDADELAALQQLEQDDAIQAWASKVRAEFVRLSNATGDFARSIDPALAASTNLTNAEKLLDKAVSENVITRGEASRLMGLYREQLSSAAGAMADLQRQAAAFNAPAGFERRFAQVVNQASNNGKEPLPATGPTSATELRSGLVDVAVGEVRDQVALVQRQATAQQLLAGAITDTARAQAQARGQFAEVIAQYPDLDAKTASAALTTKNFGVFLKTLPQPLQDLWKQMNASAEAQVAGSINQATVQMRLQSEAADRLAEAAGKGEAAQRRANIENQVAAASLHGLAGATRAALEAQEAAARRQIHADFAAQINLDVAANQRLVTGMQQGVAAWRSAEIYNKAVAQAMREVPPEYDAAGNATGRFSKAIADNVAKLKEQQSAADGVNLSTYTQQVESQGRKLALDRSLIGATPEQEAVARARFEADEWLRSQKLSYASLNDDQKRQYDNILKIAEANAKAGVEIQRWTQYGEVFTNAFDRVGDALTQAFTQGGASAVSFRSVVSGVLASIATDLLKITAITPFKNWALGGISSLLGFATGSAGGADPLAGWQSSAQAAGDAVMQLYAPTRHTGGLVDMSGAGRWVNSAVFDGARRYHTGGVAGLAPDEVPAILRRDEEVITESDPRHRFNSGVRAPANENSGSVTINMPITVNGSAGSQEQNADLAKQIGREVQSQVDARVLAVLRQQSRNGGMLSPAA
ncbi:phage tail length tape measure family protein [Azospirillum canadense]|uniref:phage tail length tape measure family protein n=1 Tax=Azospirillum canadense TaxID=403962 RepID=UPI00222664C0|nr:phage tail length tape measure family protein [Azospirillum canadense]MCW2242268.1 phage-related minor tail protein [Azospirillum canadense]